MTKTKTATKKVTKKSVVVNIDSPFRPGSTKAKVFARLQDGKPHSRKELRTICEKAEKTPTLIHWVLARLEDLKYKVDATRESVQVRKPARKAA